jgi:hypothetical protein
MRGEKTVAAKLTVGSGGALAVIQCDAAGGMKVVEGVRRTLLSPSAPI